MPEEQTNLWAPWRMEYIHALPDDEGEPCFLCRYWNNPDRDAQNHVIFRTECAMVLLNRFPYTNGHLLIAPSEHTGDFAQLSDKNLHEINRCTRDAVRLLSDAISPHGFNIGMNLSRCAGAGIPDHLHNHIVPRWNGDTNFMAVVGDVRVIPQSLEDNYQRLVDAAKTRGLT
jgi:ATP adenylyltransferase